MKRKPTVYDRGQHELICRALDVSPDPKASGSTAYEAVCVILTKLDAARDYLKKQIKDARKCIAPTGRPMDAPEAKALLKLLNASPESETFSALRLYGTERTLEEIKARK